MNDERQEGKENKVFDACMRGYFVFQRQVLGCKQRWGWENNWEKGNIADTPLGSVD